MDAQESDADRVYEAVTSDELADAITQLHGLLGAVQSQLFRLIRVYAGREAWREDGATSMTTWLTGRLRVDHRTAHRWVRTAEALAELPTVTDAYESGRLSEDQLRAVLRFVSADRDVESYPLRPEVRERVLGPRPAHPKKSDPNAGPSRTAKRSRGPDHALGDPGTRRQRGSDRRRHVLISGVARPSVLRAIRFGRSHPPVEGRDVALTAQQWCAR